MSQSPKPAMKKTSVQYLSISEEMAGQRVDNFLLTYLKNVPKSHIYRLLRKGEVRINKKRIDPVYRLQAGDMLRLPPLFLEESAKKIPPSRETMAKLSSRVIYEDDNLLVLNKPSGMSVHAGSTVRIGIIEAIRSLYPQLKQLELAHRLDTETSGCLILAKKRSVLRELHTLLREGKVNKIYWALTQGHWRQDELSVDVPLLKQYSEGGKHLVKVKADGKASQTLFRPLTVYPEATLVAAKLYTGRTHQIRVHASHQGHPIALDDRYGDAEFNKWARQKGLKRLFLHAQTISFTLPSTGQHIKVTAELDADLTACLQALEKQK